METGPIEVVLARLDERLKGYKTAFDLLVIDQKKLAEAYQELAESNHRIVGIEAEVLTLKQKYEAMELAKHVEDKKRLEDQEKKKNAWIFEIMKQGLSVGIALILLHYGVHPL